MQKTLSKLRTAILGASNLLFFNVLRVASAVSHGETVTFGANAFRASNNGEALAGHITVDLSAVSTAATGVLTITSGQNAGNDETVVIGARTYTFKTALTGAANEVLIGADRSASGANLAAAINAGSGAGTTYGTGTVAHADVTAANASGVVTITAKLKGTAANSIATTETMAEGAWGASTMASGANASAANFTTALETAVNAAGVKLFADRISANEVLFVDIATGSQSVIKACSETLAGSNNAWSAANSYGGDASIAPPSITVAARVPTATEVTLETMHFVLPYVPTSATVQIRSSAGVIRAFDGKLVITGNVIDINSDGSVKVQASDIVTITACA
jgi:hypothetical protein